LKKKLLLTIALLLIISASLVTALVLNSLIPTDRSASPSDGSEPSSPDPPPLWQTDIEHFATSIAVADGKVFMTTMQGTYAYSAQDGQFIWNTEYQGASGAQVYEGSVYVSGAGSMVYRLDETDGSIIRSYQAPAHSNMGWKGQPAFTVADGRVFVEGADGLAVYDVDSGGLYWEIYDTWYPTWYSQPEITLGELGSNETTRGGYVYIFRGARLDVNNGERLWGHWYSLPYGPSMVVDGKVVFWNYWSGSDQLNMIHCVDAAFGRTLWDFEMGFAVYEPVVYGGLLVFGASDGYLYALDLDDGSLAWKIMVDVDGWIGGNNLPAEAKSLSAPSASSIMVDDETGLGVWGFTVTQRQVDGVNGDNLYVGRFCTVDLSNGDIVGTTVVQNSSTLDDNEVVLAPGESALFLRTGMDLWTLDRATFNPTQIQHLETPIVGPVSSDGRVYIISNLHLSAYR
jgi:outer membrane protein assembly factor BamB